ncbi:MAG: valine--tRNA ligase [Candidatus Anstonellaceae archaeon]
MFELPKRIDHQIEEKWQKFWEKNKIFEFNIEDSKPVFVIDSPPPFTSGNLHMGHVLSYSYFDFVARYKRMNGYNVYFPQGWDCQGFPTEVKVEKQYGKKSPEEFRKLCIDWTKQCISNMKKQMIRLGFSPDWRYEYKTMDSSYHKIVQLSILKMYERGQIYRASHPVFWCPNCQSALSKTDTDELERSTFLYTLVFELVCDNEKENVYIATTRPELLHAIVAVLYHPKDERYSKYKNKKVFVYSPFGQKVQLLPDEDVDMNFGTGLVMVCTYGDKQDIIWCYRHKLNYIESISKDGKLLNAGQFSGLKLNEAKEKILQYLADNKKLIKKEKIQQTIRIHDRCSTPIEFLNSFQWFAKITDKKDKLISVAKKIRWVPDFAIAHFIDWASYVEWDWVISRQRVFGTPIPFWICKCGEIIPALEEELPVYPINFRKKCPKCGQEAEGESSVFDCWVDSSITPLIIAKWNEDENFFSKTYPASLRPQGIEIIRTWAFYTIYRCFELTSIPPFKEILLNGNVLAPDGKKMSKSLGNIIEPDKLLEQYGADSIRIWAALSGAMAKDRPFSYQDISFGKNLLIKLLAAGKFLLNAFNSADEIKNFDPNSENLNELSYIDKYYLSKFYYLIEKVENFWKDYQFHQIIKEVSNFFWHEFCDYYLEFIKYRIYSQNQTSNKGAKFVLHIIYSNILLLFSPFIPFTTEEIWQLFKKKENLSITFEPYPNSKKFEKFKFFSKQETEQASIFEQLAALLRKEKSAHKLSFNAQIKKVVIFTSSQNKEILKNFEPDLIATFNIQQLEFLQSQQLEVKLEI